jgi:hypothetical protein
MVCYICFNCYSRPGGGQARTCGTWDGSPWKKELERAAHALAGTYIRRAREAGLPWNLIGGALDLLPYASANKIGAGEQAHEYALSYWAGPGPRACTWDCPACQQTITDRGPGPGPPADEDGHDPACARRTAELVARERRRPRW